MCVGKVALRLIRNRPLPHEVVCEKCSGFGGRQDSDGSLVPCEECDGKGRTRAVFSGVSRWRNEWLADQCDALQWAEHGCDYYCDDCPFCIDIFGLEWVSEWRAGRRVASQFMKNGGSYES